MTIAIIGGSGITDLPWLQNATQQTIDTTPWGECSAAITIADTPQGQPLLFLPRHGIPHHIPPHQINYRANIYALHQLGAKRIIAINAVGAINPKMTTGSLVIPDQIIDYTWGRACSFHELPAMTVKHIDFTTPYSEDLRQLLIQAGTELPLFTHGTYGATQGPRLETAAEIRRMAQDGCDIVGMTGMPEAALARELAIEYACCAGIVNPAAGIAGASLDLEQIEKYVNECADKITQLLQQLLQAKLL